jgi:hypothetical protein
MGLNNSKRKQIIEMNQYYDNLEEFECCVCFSERKNKMKRIFCGHQICEKCFFKIKNNQCPMCRQNFEPIDFKKSGNCYINDPYQYNYNMEKKEILDQLDLFNIQTDDIYLIKENIGKLVVLGRLINEPSIMVYFMPFFMGKRYEIIKNYNGENIYLLYTLIDDLKKNGYDIWYDNKGLHDEIIKNFNMIIT